MAKGLIFVVAGAGMVIGAAAYAKAPGPAQGKVPRAALQPGDPNEMICEKQEVVGSRLSTRRVCKTRAQWADDRLDDRQFLEKFQVQRGLKGQ